MIIMKVPVLENRLPPQRFLKSRSSRSPNPGPKSFLITGITGGELRKKNLKTQNNFQKGIGPVVLRKRALP